MGRPVAQKRASRVTAVASGAACRWRRVGVPVAARVAAGAQLRRGPSRGEIWGSVRRTRSGAMYAYTVFSVADLFELARGTPHAVTVPSRVESVAAPGSAVLVT